MSGFGNHRRKQVVAANENALATVNPCMTCLGAMLEALDMRAWSAIPLCRFYREEDAPLQSRQVYLESGQIESEEKDMILRCVSCNNGGRDCYQMPEKIFGDVEAAIGNVLESEVVTSDKIDLSTLDEEKRESFRLAISRAATVSMGLTGGKFAGNVLTPLHSGRAGFVDTGVLGFTEKEKKKRKADLAQLAAEVAGPVWSKRRKGQPGSNLTIDDVHKRVEALSTRVEVLSAQVMVLAEAMLRVPRSLVFQRQFRNDFNAADPGEDML